MKKTILAATLSLLALAVSPAQAQNASVAAERVQASYMIAFGRAASNDEVAYWTKQNPQSVAALVQNHRTYLSRDAGTHRATITRAYIDAMGRNPTEAEIKYWSGGNDPYATLMKNHISWLGSNPGEYDNVIKRSYQYALHRQPNAGELKYWKSQGILSYAMLVACHEDWKRRNGSNSSQTSGGVSIAANSSVLQTVSLSPAIGNEARVAANIVASGAGNIVASGAGNIVASGAGNIVASGAGNIVASGAGNIVAVGAGNLTGSN